MPQFHTAWVDGAIDSDMRAWRWPKEAVKFNLFDACIMRGRR